MNDIHDELNRLTPEPDMDFLSRLDQQIQDKIEQETTNPMITTYDNITPLFDVKRLLMLAGVFLLVMFSGLLLLTYSPSPDDDLSSTILQTTPTVAAQDNCEVVPQSGWLVHIVAENHDLQTIGQRYGIGSQELLEANCLTEIEIGDRLFIPTQIGYAVIVSQEGIRAGETITEDMVRRAYFPFLPENVVREKDDIVGKIALKPIGPNQVFSTRGQHARYVGYRSIEINDQVFTAEDGKILFQVRFFISSTYYEDQATLYFQGLQEGCMWVRRQAERDRVQQCANGTTLLPRDIPTARAQAIYQGPEDLLLEATLADAILIHSFQRDGFSVTKNLPSHADQTLTVSLNALPFTQEQLDDGRNQTWRVNVDSCDEVLEEFLPCDGITLVYKIEPISISVTEPAGDSDAEALATVTLTANDAEVLSWALENNVEILPAQ